MPCLSGYGARRRNRVAWIRYRHQGHKPHSTIGGTALTLHASLTHDQRSLAFDLQGPASARLRRISRPSAVVPSRATFARALCSPAVVLRASVALAVSVLALVGLLDLSILASA